MSLHTFIDGYNLIWSTERFGTGSLRDQRERLLNFLEEHRPKGGTHGQVTVVFDGKENVDSPPWKGTVRVVFSRRHDADTAIKTFVDELSNPRNAVVVTNDQDIKKWVRFTKAKVMSCEEFLLELTRKPKTQRGRNKVDDHHAADINEEFKKIWKM